MKQQSQLLFKFNQTNTTHSLSLSLLLFLLHLLLQPSLSILSLSLWCEEGYTQKNGVITLSLCFSSSFFQINQVIILFSLSLFYFSVILFSCCRFRSALFAYVDHNSILILSTFLVRFFYSIPFHTFTALHCIVFFIF